MKLHFTKKSTFFDDVTLSEIQNYLYESNILNVFPFLMDKKNIDDLHLWLTTYLEGREYSESELEGWITKFAIIRQKKIKWGVLMKFDTVEITRPLALGLEDILKVVLYNLKNNIEITPEVEIQITMVSSHLNELSNEIYQADNDGQ